MPPAAEPQTPPPAADATDAAPARGRPPATPAPAAPIPGPAPRAIPPEGGFQAQEAAAGARGGPLALLTKKRALPIVLAGGIAALIGVLALRRRRRR